MSDPRCPLSAGDISHILYGGGESKSQSSGWLTNDDVMNVLGVSMRTWERLRRRLFDAGDLEVSRIPIRTVDGKSGTSPVYRFVGDPIAAVERVRAKTDI